MLHIETFHRMALSGTTNGSRILHATDRVNQAHSHLAAYGLYRVMSVCGVDLYIKVRKQEDLVRKRLNNALSATKTDPKKIEMFTKSCHSLIKGYELVLETAKKKGLSKLDLDFYNVEDSNGRVIYVVPNEDMKKILYLEMQTTNLCVYTMPEMVELINTDDLTYTLKSKYDATLTSNRSAT